MFFLRFFLFGPEKTKNIIFIYQRKFSGKLPIYELLGSRRGIVVVVVVVVVVAIVVAIVV